MCCKYNLTTFLKSVPKVNFLPKDFGLEIAFVGYSNTGKSSILNSFTNKKKLAFVGKSPGRTRLINLFQVEKEFRLVDFPGYGYSKFSKKTKKKLYECLINYLKKRNCLKGLIISVDIRRSIKTFDKKIIYLALQKKISILILLNKSDLLSKQERKEKLNKIKKIVNKISKEIEIYLFSTTEMVGINNLIRKLNFWSKKSNLEKHF